MNDAARTMSGLLSRPLATERLAVRRFLPSDGESLFAYLSLPETYLFEPGSPVTREEADRMAAERAGGQDFFAVCLHSGEMAGHLYFHRREPLHFDTWELGYIFNPAYQGRGYCTEAARSLIGHAFGALGAHRIEAMCDPRNAASWRVLERLGMRREGHFRERAFFRRDGAGAPIWHDAWAYGILSSEWEKR